MRRKQLETSLVADLHLTESQVQDSMTYASAKMESEGSLSQHDDVQPPDNSADKSWVLNLKERDAEEGQQGEDFRSA